MRKIEFTKPNVIIDENENISTYGKFTIMPLERGFGLTIGNSLRRILLSSLPGAAVVAISIEGVEHEFTSINGVVEDVTEIILNIKNIILKIDEEKTSEGIFSESNELRRMEIVVAGPSTAEEGNRIITAADIACDPDIKIVNPDQVIAKLAKGSKLKMELFARRGVGYVSAEDNKVFCKNKDGQNVIGRLAIDSIYTPITRCRYDVEKTRVGDNVDYDKLIIEIWTNGGFKPLDALSLASKFMIDHLNVIADQNEAIRNREYIQTPEEKKTNKKFDMKIEDLDLSVRSYNCLKRAGINTVGELTQKTEEDMMRIRNLGRKSLKEVVLKLREHNLDLKRTYDSSLAVLDLDDDYDDDDEDQISTKDNDSDEETEEVQPLEVLKTKSKKTSTSKKSE
jgi:DNA-directed RNA polymerase subunit alpha